MLTAAVAGITVAEGMNRCPTALVAALLHLIKRPAAVDQQTGKRMAQVMNPDIS